MMRTICIGLFAGAVGCTFVESISAAAPAVVGDDGYRILHSFNGQNGDGGIPEAGLIKDDAGNLYGTTSEGGNYPTGMGVVFKIAPDGTETVLYEFCRQAPCTDGANPEGGVIRDSAGNLYGTTSSGGTGCQICGGGGTVFKLAPDGTETVLYNFCSKNDDNCDDGYNPQGNLISDKAGNLYGTTYGGGVANWGVAFEVAPDGTEKVLYDFGHGGGKYPGASGVVKDKAGYFYGTAWLGGLRGDGTVFEIAPHHAETVVYSFCNKNNCTDGAGPTAGVIEDRTGNLYGTTEYGGDPGCDNHAYCGVIFEIAPNGTETVLHRFNSADGGNPVAGLIRDKAGNLYGTTYWGGNNNRGTVFRLAPDGTETVLHSFGSGSDGESPRAGLIEYNGYLYGTTSAGRSSDNLAGIVFELRK